MSWSSKQVFSRYLRLRSLLFINLCILGILLFSFGKEFLRTRSIEQEIQELEQQANSLTARHQELTQWQRLFQTEGFLEREARLKLGLQKPGEQIIVIDRSPQITSTLATEESHSSKGFSSFTENPKKWWRYFFLHPSS